MKVPMVTTESGLQYKDIKIGEGPSPPVGFQASFLDSQNEILILKTLTIYEVNCSLTNTIHCHR